LNNIAIRAAVGTSARKSSKRLAVSSAWIFTTPVAFPPGRFRLATSPAFTGSAPPVNTWSQPWRQVQVLPPMGGGG
jgi:hypothetical protein